MYLVVEMITDLGLKGSESWPSDTHKHCAEAICIGNDNITTLDKLRDVVAWVNKRDEEFLKTATVGNLIDAGAPIT